MHVSTTLNMYLKSCTAFCVWPEEPECVSPAFMGMQYACIQCRNVMGEGVMLLSEPQGQGYYELGVRCMSCAPTLADSLYDEKNMCFRVFAT